MDAATITPPMEPPLDGGVLMQRRVMRMDMQTLLGNAGDLGMVDGVLQGIALTPKLLPHQQQAVVCARKALERIIERNQEAIKALASNPHNYRADQRRAGRNLGLKH